jgi:glycosyltransferase involved in cell wall biosynthesis
VSRVHLFTHSYAPRNAVGNHTRHVRELLRENDLLGNFYVWDSRGTKRGEVKSYTEFSESVVQPGDIALYQLSTGSKVGKMLAGSGIPLIVNYHNITPPELFYDWEAHVGGELEKGLEQLRELAPRTELGIAVSHFNEDAMREAGYRQTTVVPFLFDTNSFIRESDSNVDAEIQARRKSGEHIWLFVGRVAPNKCQQ